MNSDKIMSASFAMQPLRTTVAEPFIAKAVAIDYPKQIVGEHLVGMMLSILTTTFRSGLL